MRNQKPWRHGSSSQSQSENPGQWAVFLIALRSLTRYLQLFIRVQAKALPAFMRGTSCIRATNIIITPSPPHECRSAVKEGVKRGEEKKKNTTSLTGPKHCSSGGGGTEARPGAGGASPAENIPLWLRIKEHTDDAHGRGFRSVSLAAATKYSAPVLRCSTWLLLQADAEFSLTTCERPVMFDLARNAAVDNLAAFQSMIC